MRPVSTLGVSMKIDRPEQTAQIGAVSWLRAATIAPARFWFVPNGVGAFSIKAAGVYKEMGLTSGVHDLHFIWQAEEWTPGDDTGGRFGTIEMKAPKARKDATTTEQKQFGADMVALGHRWAEARSLDEVLDTLIAWGYPLRSPSDTVKYAFAHGLKLKASPAARFR